jgi:7-cyano-7-deazaguanine synthase
MTFLEALEPRDAASALAIDPRQPGLLSPRLLRLLPILSVAVPFAVHHQAAAIYSGVRVGQGMDELAQGMEYTQILNELVQLPCRQADLEMIAPLLELEPWQVVDVGHQVSAPMDRAWSCLEEGAEPCGGCRGCRQREAAFQQAGKADPTRAVRR